MLSTNTLKITDDIIEATDQFKLNFLPSRQWVLAEEFHKTHFYNHYCLYFTFTKFELTIITSTCYQSNSNGFGGSTRLARVRYDWHLRFISTFTYQKRNQLCTITNWAKETKNNWNLYFITFVIVSYRTYARSSNVLRSINMCYYYDVLYD